MSHAVCCWCSAPLVKIGSAWWCGHPDQNLCRARQRKHAQYAVDRKGQQTELVYLPLPKQTVWHEAAYRPDITRLLIGGAAGPGKSTCIRRILYEFAMLVPGFHALLLRKTHKDLDKSHLRFLPFEVSQLGGAWKAGDRVAVFPHKGQMDSIIRAGHFEDASAIEDYLSSEFDLEALDEIVTLDEAPTLELFTRARSTNPVLFQLRGLEAEGLDGSFVLAGSNPGGRLWVKDHWITKAPDPEEYPNYDAKRWGFYDAKLSDNPYLREGYRESLRGLHEMRRRQLEDGDWDVFAGQMFAEWTPRKHVGTFEALYGYGNYTQLEWFASLDGGFNAPLALYWWLCLPDGRFHLVREWKESGVFADELAQRFWKITRDDLGLGRPRYVVAGGDIDAKHGLKGQHGETVYETLSSYGMPMKRADRDRKNGWFRLHQLLRDSPYGTPWLTVDPSCVYLQRTIAAAPSDPKDPDELAPEFTDDHGLESVRYGGMSRPSPTVFRPAEKVGGVGAMVRDLIAGQRPGVLGSTAVRMN